MEVVEGELGVVSGVGWRMGMLEQQINTGSFGS
jgi:hypothetical protein